MSIRIESLSKSFGSQIAVNSITFSIKKGEIVGFLGPNGSGKSTTMKCICGILPPDRGIIEVSGLNTQEELIEVKRRIGYLPEDNPLHPEMYVKEYLSFVDGFYKKQTNRKQRIEEIIELTGLENEKSKKIGYLSKGYKQRVGLAQAIIHDPEVLILDEPTTGLDPNQIVDIRNVISGLAKNKTVLLSTHILQEVEAICDRILVLNQGILVADGTSSSIKNSQLSKKQTIYIEFSISVEKDFLRTIEGVEEVKMINEKEFLLEGFSSTDLREDIFQFVSKKKLAVLTMQKREETLEEAFRKLTRHN
jgi:ABC-2 type transport system ATP-binding protein